MFLFNWWRRREATPPQAKETATDCIAQGNRLLDEGKPEEAVARYEAALAIDASNADACICLGFVLKELGKADLARRHLLHAIQINPQSEDAHLLLGMVAKSLDDALVNYDRAISIKPDFAEAYQIRGNAHFLLKQYKTALADYERAMALKPNIKYAFGVYMHLLMKTCCWDSYSDKINHLITQVEKGAAISPPFYLLALSGDLAIQRQCAEIYTTDKYPTRSDPGPVQKHGRHEKIRIGYFSADFRQHPVSYLMAEVFELHDRSKFELIGFAFGKDSQDEMRQRISAAFDQFIDARDLSDQQLAVLSRELGIDIAIDLGGYTEDCRTNIFALRAAPIQVSYLGYLGTMGAPYIDYLLADRIVIPERNKPYYSEKIAYLPSYQANDSRRTISDRTFTREELGLPKNGFVYCCFNNNYKITPPTFDSWMRILSRVDGSVLFLLGDSDIAISNQKKEARQRGVDPDRLIFGDPLPRPDYLARYRVADLFLDTLPYNAGTTASDALWAGLPVLTQMGESFSSRVGASVLTAIELPELITATQDDYEALAVELATNPGKLQQLRQKLAQHRLTTPLFDSPLFTRNLEAAYTAMYERLQANLPPEHIFISPPAA